MWDDREQELDGAEIEEPRYDEEIGATYTRSDYYFLNDELSYSLVRTRAELPEGEDFVELYAEYDRISDTSAVYLFFYNERGELIASPCQYGHRGLSTLPISFTSDGKRILKQILDDFFHHHIVPGMVEEEEEEEGEEEEGGGERE